VQQPQLLEQGVNKNGVLAGQVAVVSGASRGIGEYIAKRYAMEGARVVVSARTVAEGEHYLPGTITDTVAAINSAGGEAIAIKADLAVQEDAEALMRPLPTSRRSPSFVRNTTT